MNCKVVKSVNEINRIEWNSIVEDDAIQLKYDYLKSIEESDISGNESRYIVVYNNEKLIAGLPIFISRSFFLDAPLTGKFKKFTSKVRKVIPNFLRRKAIFCGCCISEYNKILINNQSNKKEVIDIIIKELKQLSKVEKIKLVIFKDFLDTDISEEMKFYKYFEANSLPDTYINTDLSSFDEYLSNLKIKHRQNIRNKINRNKKTNKLSIEVVDDFYNIIDEIYSLYENTYNKSQNKFERLQKDFFVNINRNMQSNSKVIIAKVDDKIVGYSLIVVSDNVCVNVRTGIDYNYSKKYFTYFILHYYNINFAIENNMKRLYLSQTSYRVKSEMGAELIPLMVYIKHFNVILNTLYVICFKIFFKRYELLSKSTDLNCSLRRIFPESFSGDIQKGSV